MVTHQGIDPERIIMRVFGFWSFAAVFLAVLLSTGLMAPQTRATARAADAPTAVPPPTAPAAADTDDDDDAPSAMAIAKTPEQRMQARFPQPIRVGDLIGQSLLDGDHATIGFVQHVVRSADGKIKLVISYRSWLSWAQFLTSYDVRSVAVPIEVVGSMGPALSSIDMTRESYITAPTWTPGTDRDIPAKDVIQIAIARE
jgi:hypothetical protein